MSQNSKINCRTFCKLGCILLTHAQNNLNRQNCIDLKIRCEIVEYNPKFPAEAFYLRLRTVLEYKNDFALVFVRKKK